VVTGVSPEGKSEVVIDVDTPGYFDLAVSEFDVIWLSDSSPPDLLGSSDPADVDHYVMKPPPGGIKWVVIRTGADQVTRRAMYRSKTKPISPDGVSPPNGLKPNFCKNSRRWRYREGLWSGAS